MPYFHYLPTIMPLYSMIVEVSIKAKEAGAILILRKGCVRHCEHNACALPRSNPAQKLPFLDCFGATLFAMTCLDPHALYESWQDFLIFVRGEDFINDDGG
jgi:hypothetical protein